MLVKRFYSKKWPPKCSGEASGGILTAPGRPQEALKGRQKKIEIGPRGRKDAPRREISRSKTRPFLSKTVPMPIEQIFVHIECEKILDSIFGPFLALFLVWFFDHFCIIFNNFLYHYFPNSVAKKLPRQFCLYNFFKKILINHGVV